MPKLLIMLLALQAAALVVVVWAFREWRFKRRIVQQMIERGERPASRRWTAKQIRTLAILFGTAALMFPLMPRVQAKLGLFWGTAAGFGTLFLVAFVLILLSIRRNFDRVAAAANLMARQRNAKEAIEILQYAMQVQPTVQRAAVLATLLTQADRYQEAADAFARAEQLDELKVLYAVQHALMLAKAGQPQAALAALEARRARSPQQGAFAIVAASVLADMGRLEEAREQLRQGEELRRAFNHDQRIAFSDFLLIENLMKELKARLGSGERAFEVRAAATEQSGPGG